MPRAAFQPGAWVPHEAEETAAVLREVVAQAPFAMAMLDRQLRYRAWSRAWSALYGLADRDVTGLAHAELFPDRSEPWGEAVNRCLQGEAVEGFDHRLCLTDGREIWLRWSLWPLRGRSGAVAAVALCAEDISAWKQAEAELALGQDRLEQITWSLDIGLFEYDFRSGDMQISDGYLHLLGLAHDQAPMTERDWIAVLRPADMAAYTAARQRALDPAGDGRFFCEFHPIVEGEERTLEVKSRVHFSGVGAARRPERLIGIIADRTESRRLQGALSQAQRLETVGRLAGMVAHDFNNLLTVILSNLELADLRTADPEVRHLLRQAAEAAESGAGFTKRLLVLAGGQRGAAVPVLVDEHIGQVWDLYQRVLSDSIAFRFHPGAGGAAVRIDPAEIDGAVLNLVVNARDAQPAGGEVILSTDVVEIGAATASQIRGGKPGRFLRLSVRDRGPGMPPEVAARAGEPFFSTKGAGKGSGLGLTSVTLTAERAGGFLQIVSAPGQGTDARIHLPLTAPPSAPSPEEAEYPFGNGELVLVVEDDALLREAVMQRLEAIGYAVIEAASGEAALALIEAGEPVDLVFSDVVMPGALSGYDLVRKLRDSHPDIAVLLTSGHVSEAYRDRVPPDPPVELLTKPYPLKTLARSVANALRQGPAPE